MKKLMTVVFTMLLAGSLAFAQTGGGSTDQKAPAVKSTGKKATKSRKSHKGGKKSKKGSSSAATTTTPTK